MKNRYPLLLCFGLFSFALTAQQRTLINFQLRSYLQRTEPSTMVDLFLQGDAASVARVAMTHGGSVKMATHNWVSVRMPAARIAELNDESAVRSIEFTLDKGHTMNDSMRVKTHIDWVQQGLAPLQQAYDGEGVIMGVIDTGLDFTHPDFLDSLGNTRVLKYWDQHYPFDAVLTPMPYGYGRAWDSAAINAGTCPATDPNSQFGHGTSVAGTAAGNGGSDHRYIGAAPKADLIIVSTDFNHANWANTVVDGIQYIFNEAAALGRPAVVNLSIGEALGSHDGLDPAALMIDDMLSTPGRSVVCAAGNSGCWGPFHLRSLVSPDSSFTWFKYNSSTALFGYPVVYFDLWADTADFNNVQYSIGADRVTGGFAYRGRIPFRTIDGTVNVEVVDTLLSFSGNRLGVVHTLATLRGGQYHLEVQIPTPDSTSNYYYRFTTTGTGRFDSWEVSAYGESEIVSQGLPTPGEYPPMAKYAMPDAISNIVDAWACSPHVITVGNYLNEQVYTAVNGNLINLGNAEGIISGCSSVGPTRTDLLKPDVAAPGDITMSAVPLAYLNALFIQNQLSNINKIASDSLHMRGGGTSIASPSVAGAAALYLQKCPMATADEIRNAINNTAFADANTGTLPNNTWGNGKVDAFAALVYSNFQADILGGPGSCGEDSVILQTQAFLQGYDWSTGDSNFYTYAQPGLVTLTVVNNSGCISTADSLVIYPSPVAAVPSVTAAGVDLSSSLAVTYQWALNGSLLPGATAQNYSATANGAYTVTITDANGCSATSAPVAVVSVGIGEVVMTEGIRIWPVPASDELLVELAQGGSITNIEVVDMSGAIVPCAWSKSVGLVTLQVRSLATGVYSLRVSDATTIHNVRFVKQ